MIRSLATTRGAVMRAAAAAWASLLVVGCATPPQMQLSPQTPETPGAAVWWYIRHPANLRSPIVAVEQRLSSTACRQTVFCDRGVRWFDYHRGRLKHSSPPLPGAIAETDTDVFGAVLRRVCVGASCAIPDEEIAAIRSPDDLIQSLQRHWRDAQVASPEGMSYRRIDGELEHFPHGVIELKEASKPF